MIVELNAVLCNHAQVENNQLFINGGGIDRTWVPGGAPMPVGVNLAIGLTVRVPWQQTNQQHTLVVTMEDSDGAPVMVPNGPDEEGPLRGEIPFNMGRPPDLVAGAEQTVSLAIAMPGLPLSKIDRYAFVISIDGTEVERLPYALMTMPGVTFSPG